VLASSPHVTATHRPTGHVATARKRVPPPSGVAVVDDHGAP